MERKLTDTEKNRIIEIYRVEKSFYEIEKIFNILAPILYITFFIWLYYQINWGSILIYITIGVILSIVTIISILNIQKPIKSIVNNTCTCFETTMKGSRISESYSSQGNTVEIYYLIFDNNGENIEVEYKGNEFDKLVLGDSILVIRSKNIFNKDKYICFSYNEVNN